MRYRNICMVTGEIVTGKKMKKYVDPNSEMKQVMQNRYTYRQVNGGRPEGWGASQDLNDHSTRPMPGSMLRSIAEYGTEWSAISRNARADTNWTCEECGAKPEPRDLHVHHKKTIKTFINAGAAWVEEHLCHGVKTKRPYHSEDNLRVLCRTCHGDEHGRDM